ncbi:DUF1501 domain-containing protein [Brevifollis gellanilyticus]|uniref:DUF1501 domain-containing protein n=1 Tax=Brevifollis gellanilyticus TaxID=748831 RepID=A0A512MD32_9BACT|nr:DUF1501 domain-containing protein [Brevifollis gellanilyticus]GEP44643.1 hypothetical protein BGE01nite_39340 [Brevifollis gellanilyticus]
MNIFIRKSEDRSKPNRRDFLLQTGCASMGITSLVNTLAQLKLTGAAAAQSAGDDYKALVCLFLNGGNDSNNLLIPAAGSTARTDYQSGRGVLAVSDASFNYTPGNNNGYFNESTGTITLDPVTSRLTPTNATVGGTSQFDPLSRPGYTNGSMALHPGAYPLKTLFEKSELSFFANIGTLVGTQNITRANFNTLPASTKPPQLFSHSDQQTQWQSSLPDRPFSSGWGGRVADIVASMNSGDLGVNVSIAGANSFLIGGKEQPYFMSSSGAVTALTGFSGGSPSTSYGGALRNAALRPDFVNLSAPGANKYSPAAALNGGSDPLSGTNYVNSSAGWRFRALEQIMAASHNSLFDNEYAETPKSARNTEGLVGTALSQTASPNPTLDAHWSNWFPGGFGQTDLSNQLKVVARLIAGRSLLSNKRQIFFVQVGGYDTHTSQIPSTAVNQGHYSLVNNLSRSIRAFRDAMVSLGMWNNVMLFTASDFNRTFTPNKNDATGGSDHAWGGHSLVCGGAVKGRQILGQFPDLTVNGGIDCTGNRGRWIPTTAVDQKVALISKWFGVPESRLTEVVPNFLRFMPDLSTTTLQQRNLDFINFG